MAANKIEEKRGALDSEEKALREKIESNYAALGRMIATNVECPREVQENVDFAGLWKDSTIQRKINKLLISIDKDSLKREEIKKEIEKLKSIKTCPKCGNIVGEDELFCAECGERLPDADYDDTVCPQCGKPRKGDGAFCVFCGFKFGVKEPEKSEAAKERTCVKCGTKLPEDVLFCHICGYRQPE